METHSAQAKDDAPAGGIIMDPHADQEPADDAPAGPSLPLDRVLPYTGSEDWLACFQSSTAMANQVLRHATRTRLTLRLLHNGGGEPSGDSSNSSSAPNVQVAQRLAAPAEDVALTMQCGLVTPDECLRHSITSIRLQHVQLPGPDVVSSTLQLQLLPRLHTLSLQECRVNPDSSTISGSTISSGFLPASSIHTLECINSKPTELPGSADDESDGASESDDPEQPEQPHPAAMNTLPLALSLVDPEQLQTITTNEVTVLDHMGQLTALQELRLQSSHADGPRVCDAVQRGMLLVHPGLKRLSLGRFNLDSDCSEQPCTLDSLELLGGAGTDLLTRLPLASLPSLTVHDIMWVDVTSLATAPADIAKAIANMQKCVHLAFKPAATEQLAQHSDPEFTLCPLAVRYVYSPELDAAEYGQLVTLCIQHLASGTALALYEARLSPPILASLEAAPPTISTIWFEQCTAPHGNVGAVASLPAHIAHVVVSYSGARPIWFWRDYLPRYVQGVDRSLRLTLRTSVWEEGVLAEVQRWLSENASRKLQVHFQPSM